MSPFHQFLISAGFILSLLDPSFAAGAETPEGFLSAYRPALQRLEAGYANYQCNAHHIRPTYEADVAYFVKGTCFQSQTTYSRDVDQRPPNYPQLQVRSSCGEKKVFQLAQEREGMPFLVRGAGSRGREEMERYQARYCKPIALAALHVFNASVRALIEHPATAIERVETVERDGVDFIEVAFAIDADTFKFHRAIVYFWPEREWVVRAYDLAYEGVYTTGKRTVVYHGEVEYAEKGHYPVPVPQHVRIVVRQGPESEKPVEEATVVDVEFDKVADEQFTFEHFGLPDYDVVHSESGGWLAWFVALNGAILVVSLAYLVKHRRAKS